MSRRFVQRDASLMQIAAAIVGTAAAVQVVPVHCRDPHCPSFGDPDFGEGTCPAEHADAWRFDFPEHREVAKSKLEPL